MRTYLQRVTSEYSWFVGFMIKPLHISSLRLIGLSDKSYQLVKEVNSLIEELKRSVRDDYLLTKQIHKDIIKPEE